MSDIKNLALSILDKLTKLSEGEDIKVESEEACRLIAGAKELCDLEANILDVKMPLNGQLAIIGDIHGQWRNLRYVFGETGRPSESNILLINGDFGGRGPQSVEVFLYLAAHKILYSNAVFLLRGNHESDDIATSDGCECEMMARLDERCYEDLLTFFKALPLACVLEGQRLANESAAKRIFVVHGGIPVTNGRVVDLKEIRCLERRKTPPKGAEILTQLLWNDICCKSGTQPSKRSGWGFCIGQDDMEKFLDHNDLTEIVRSHDTIPGCPSVREDHRCTTVFSAHFDNVAWLQLDCWLGMKTRSKGFPGNHPHHPGEYRYYEMTYEEMKEKNPDAEA